MKKQELIEEVQLLRSDVDKYKRFYETLLKVNPGLTLENQSLKLRVEELESCAFFGNAAAKSLRECIYQIYQNMDFANTSLQIYHKNLEAYHGEYGAENELTRIEKSIAEEIKKSKELDDSDPAFT
jgi:hypothetical protein